jgi:5-methylcytosine-specific restriction endonuclease McrA
MRSSADRQRCFREPISQIFDCARYLDAAVSAHIAGRTKLAEELFSVANDQAVWDWTNSVWGKNSQYVQLSGAAVRSAAAKATERMPTPEKKAAVLARDRYRCRYCGIPVIRAEVRKAAHRRYPLAVPWGRTNNTQHAGFQAMWAQYDHVVPHSHGGGNEIDNLVLACAACNFGKMHYTLEELGLADPRLSTPEYSSWNGLERFLAAGI